MSLICPWTYKIYSHIKKYMCSTYLVLLFFQFIFQSKTIVKQISGVSAEHMTGTQST